VTPAAAMTLSRAASQIPGNPHPATVKRWIRDGVKSVRTRKRVYLAGQRIGGRWYVTQSAIDRFAAETTDQPEPPQAAAPCRSARTSRRRHNEAMEKLHAFGVV